MDPSGHIHGSRSTHHVKKMSTELPGFRDGRTGAGAGKEQHDNPRRNSSSRGRPRSAVSKDNTECANNNNNILARRSRSSSRRRRCSQHGAEKKSSSNTASKNTEDPSLAITTEKINKFSNMTHDPPNKYKQVYEAMLKEMEKDKNDSAWVGLGHCDGEKSCGRPSMEEGALVVSQKSNSKNNRRNSRSRSRGSSCNRRWPSADSSKDNSSESEGHRKNTKVNTKQKKGLFCSIKKIAGVVKTILGDLGGISGVHKYKLGERARHKLCKIPKSLKSHADPETWTVEVEIVAVHIDAVLKMPYYTIKLPDETRKQTNWDKLVPLSDYKRVSKAIGHTEDTPDPSTRHRHHSSSRTRTPSRHGERRGSSSRDSRRQRSLSQGDAYHSSTSSHRRSRSNSSSRKGRDGNSGSNVPYNRRPRSPSPVQQRVHSSSKRRSSRSEPRKERSPSPFTRNSSGLDPDTRRPSNRLGWQQHPGQEGTCLYFDDELNTHFLPVGGYLGTM